MTDRTCHRLLDLWRGYVRFIHAPLGRRRSVTACRAHARERDSRTGAEEAQSSTCAATHAEATDPSKRTRSVNADPARCAAAGDGRRCPKQPLEGCRTHRNHDQLRGARASVDEGCACHERIHGSGAPHSKSSGARTTDSIPDFNGHDNGAVNADGPAPQPYCRCEWYCR